MSVKGFESFKEIWNNGRFMATGSPVNSPNLTLSPKVVGYLDPALSCAGPPFLFLKNEVGGPIFACDSGENFSWIWHLLHRKL